MSDELIGNTVKKKYKNLLRIWKYIILILERFFIRLTICIIILRIHWLFIYIIFVYLYLIIIYIYNAIFCLII